jgi:hypothetical protein
LRALQDALYRFGTPWYERSGPQIFRDESGLAASPDLWEILRAALNESEYFIYLASPESARSFYTQKEIEYWLAQRGPDQVILALATGNIRWNEGATAFDSQVSDALPEVLHTAFDHTPLYVDLRDVTAANWRLTDPLFRDRVATIASALHGKSKDELYGMQVSALIMSDAERMARDAQAALVSIDRSLDEPEGYLPAQSCRIWDLWSPHPGDSCVILPDLDRGVDRIKMTSDNRWLITSSRDGILVLPAAQIIADLVVGGESDPGWPVGGFRRIGQENGDLFPVGLVVVDSAEGRPPVVHRVEEPVLQRDEPPVPGDVTVVGIAIVVGPSPVILLGRRRRAAGHPPPYQQR